jgi:hypothetical protein
VYTKFVQLGDYFRDCYNGYHANEAARVLSPLSTFEDARHLLRIQVEYIGQVVRYGESRRVSNRRVCRMESAHVTFEEIF